MRTWDDFEALVKSVNTPEELDDLETTTSFAVKLIKLRQERGWTQAELAQRAGLKQSAIARIEGGDSVPRIDTAMRIAKALGMKLDFVRPGQEQDRSDDMSKRLDRIELMLGTLISLLGRTLEGHPITERIKPWGYNLGSDYDYELDYTHLHLSLKRKGDVFGDYEPEGLRTLVQPSGKR
jgi:transcriptional regulator with XRE-family HTH domain